MSPQRFTYPFRYTPLPAIVGAAREMSARIDNDPRLKALFAEGKMLGVMMVEHEDGTTGFIHAFSGLAGGRSIVEGFVPPILDLTVEDGYFKREEARIVGMSRRIARMCSENAPEEEIQRARRERRDASVALQEWIFDSCIVSNARGERLSIAEIFALKGMVPPGGTGDCAAPKLLNYAYGHGLKPIAMGEYWYGASPRKELRRAGSFYPACTGKCGPLLSFMLQGLEVEDDPLAPSATPDVRDIRIIYEDGLLLVIDKPSGMLSVPGRTGRLSAPELLRASYGDLYPCHRLDMDTSGLMVYARDPVAQAEVQKQFASRAVKKTYKAVLLPGGRHLEPGDSGRIDIPIAPDWYDRPRQSADPESGKKALTEYEVLSVAADGRATVRFIPHTGRTHQLRVHSAHPDGLGRPIEGDCLYGGGTQGGPLALKADSLTFLHPGDGRVLHFQI